MKALKWALIAVCSIFILVEAAGYFVSARGSGPTEAVSEKPKDPAMLRAANSKLEAKLRSLAPKGVYIVVDTGGSRLYLKNSGDASRECIMSSGNGNVLEDPSTGKKWTFDTPRGEFTVKSKAREPVWIKPNWAFVEEGEAAPKDYRDRAEPGVLGDYALGIGNGFFIHGTLYTRLLGRNVTHGCIRVGDEDLETVFKASPLGTHVYIF